MKITLESTSKMVEINGCRTRLWEGTTEKGVPVMAFISALAIDREHDNSEPEADLVEMPEPAIRLRGCPLCHEG